MKTSDLHAPDAPRPSTSTLPLFHSEDAVDHSTLEVYAYTDRAGQEFLAVEVVSDEGNLSTTALAPEQVQALLTALTHHTF